MIILDKQAVNQAPSALLMTIGPGSDIYSPLTRTLTPKGTLKATFPLTGRIDEACTLHRAPKGIVLLSKSGRHTDSCILLFTRDGGDNKNEPDRPNEIIRV